MGEMNRIQQVMDSGRSNSRKVLVSYIVAGDPSLEVTVPFMHDLVSAGTDIIELGVPFSDPSAEGPSIQRAHERALANKIGLSTIFDMVAEFRQRNSHTPVVLMGYANPIEWMGYQEFARRASSAGVDGVLTVDIPPEEAGPIDQVLKQSGLLNVFLMAPTTTLDRIDTISSMASGFLYYVSLKGVTGSGDLDVGDVESRLAEIRAKTSLPICVGFGIKSAESARAVSKVADGVVVGSAIIDNLVSASDEQLGRRAAQALVADIRSAIDQH